MKQLNIAAGLSLPLDAATQTFAFIARKGAGKTYAAGKLVELLLDASVQVVVLDTVGNWYGLRLGANGKASGYDVPVLGGLRGDIPLEPTGGKLIAEIVVETGRSMVLDVSQWSKADRQRFAASFGEQLWLKKKSERHPSPVMLVIEESQLIVPQDVRGDTATMVGVYEEIIRLGRNYGIGVTMITQRPQSVNKEVLNQTECLFVGQVNGAQERDALKKWITHQGSDVHLVDELPALKIGTFYVWSPQWLNVFQKVAINPKTTYDASATPKVGDTRVQRDLKELNLDDLRTKMVETIEKSKATDPKELHKRLAAAQKEIARLTVLKDSEVVVEPERPMLTDADRYAFQKFDKAMRDAYDAYTSRVQSVLETMTVEFGKHASTISKAFADSGLLEAVRKVNEYGKDGPPRKRWGRDRNPGIAHLDQPDLSVNGRQATTPYASHPPEIRILDALAWWAAIGVKAPTRAQVAFVARYSVNGHFNNLLGMLRTNGFVDYPDGGCVALTDVGAARAAKPAKVPTRAELIDRARSVIRQEPLRRIFDVVVEIDDDLSREELAKRCRYSVNGHFNNLLGKLRTLGLITYPKGGYVGLSELFNWSLY